MRRKLSKLMLISSGAALAWFLDPVSGAGRRRKVTDQLSGLTGGSPTGSDPTGGAVPPAVAKVQPAPAPVQDADVAQAVEAATGAEKVPRTSAEAEDAADKSRATLRTTW